MKKTTNFSNTISPNRELLDRRDYLRLAGAAGIAGVGVSALSGTAGANATLSRTLTIEGTGSTTRYQFSVGGNLAKSRAMGASIQDNDVISGNSATGYVGGGRDSYAFTEEVTDFSTNGDHRLYLNGEPLTDTVTIEDIDENKRTNYELVVDGEVMKSPAMAATIDENDEITPRNDADSVSNRIDGEALAGETYVFGGVNEYKDSYVISGEITGFHADGNVNLYVNEELVDRPSQFGRNTLTFESTDGNRADYTFSVSGDITKSAWMGATVNDSDTVDKGTATGYMTNGRDSYAYTGEITNFESDSNLRVWLNGEPTGTDALNREPQFENTLTIEGLGPKTEYRFSVEGDLAENYGLSGEDKIDGNLATGAVSTGQDSYTFSGDISNFEPDGNAQFKTYLNGKVTDPDWLGRNQTSVDAELLPNSVAITGIGSDRKEYGVSVTGFMGVDESEDTSAGDNASGSFARGFVTSGTDEYRHSGEIVSLTDYETFQIDVDQKNKTIDIEDFKSGTSINYEIVVSGELSRTSSLNGSDTISGGTATGGVAGGTDTYGYTGDIQKLEIVGTLRAELVTPYPRLIDNPYPDATVTELALESAKAPGSQRVAFTSNAIGDNDELYLARGISLADEVPPKVQLVSEGIIAGVADIEWKDENTLTFWRDGFACEQTMKEGNVMTKPIAVSNEPHPKSNGDGGAQ